MKIMGSICAIVALTACSTPIAAKDDGGQSSVGEKASSTAASSSAKFTSHYTKWENASCVIVEMDEESAGYVKERCGEYEGVPLFRVEGDLRQHAYAGNPPSGQTTIAPFNYLGDIVEWRLMDGVPVALIYRLRADAPDLPGNGRTQLFVQKIGAGDEQSCIIGMIAGSYPNANETAHGVADTAASIACNDDFRPVTFGELM